MTLLREAEHQALSKLTLSGKVLDLGGDARSAYRSFCVGSFTITTVNIDEKARPNIIADLEQPLPIPDGTYDAALLINVLEHVYDYHALLLETHRVLRMGGQVAIVVPFIFPNHPSPADYHRFTHAALERLLSEVGFTNISITPLGSGVFAAQFLLIERLLPSFCGALHPFVRELDSAFTGLAQLLGKRYSPADYALGFFVTAYRA